MSSNPSDKYKRLLDKEPFFGDEYVIVDAKWLEHWKRFVGIVQSDEKDVTDPGPIDFTKLAAPNQTDCSRGVQLREDAVEKNDYTFIPLDLYEEIVKTHKKVGKEIIRKAIKQGDYNTVIETFLVPLRICQSRTTTERAKQVYCSRRTKLEDLKKDICKEFSIGSDFNVHLCAAMDDKALRWEQIDKELYATIEDVDLNKNAFITCESRAMTATKTSYSPSNSYYTPGLCGLSNLGNTCFMNSALQCLSNVPPLTRYFQDGAYKHEINRDNPLGMKGDVASAYAELIREMWSGNTTYCAPKSLKHNVARYAPQFSGYAQQDSQEFMSFLLDGLHEDLNRVKKKPYVEKKDDDGKLDDATLAAEQWDYYQKRNQSKIQEIFHGQIKSVVQCLTCKTTGRTFDPICFLSLPLPGKGKIRTYKIDYVRLNGKLKTYQMKCDENGRMRNLVQDFCSRFEPKEKKPSKEEPMDTGHTSKSNATNSNEQDQDDDEQEDEVEDFTKDPDYDGHRPRPDFILAAEVYNHRIHLQYTDNSSLNNVLERDRIVFYEVADSLKKENNEKILMPCVFREDDYYHHNFGLPIYVSVPRNKCKGKDVQEALQKIIGNFLPLPSTTDSSENPLYNASLSVTQNYYQTSKSLKSSLDEPIDFGRQSTTLVVDVAQSVVEKYKKQEEAQRTDTNHSTLVGSSMQTRSQEKRQTTLAGCFKLFTKKEVLSDDDLWKCPTCNQLKKATKKIDLWVLPKILIVQLKRFNYNRYFRDKIDILVDCPLKNLDLSAFVQNPAEKAKAKYDLIAVSNHMGGLGGGHYTAYAKNSVDQKWHSFDDSYVSSVREDEVISRSAYVLIYKQQQ